MCGIAGFMDKRGLGDSRLLHRMCQAIEHRGPDDRRVHLGEHISLGQQRLSIIDLTPEASPPLSNEDGKLWLVFNGEIYNYQSLREDLQSRGHRFATRSDTEVIVHAYEEYGEECVHHFNGMFAFAIWDTRKHELFLARDRMGKKPLYYSRNADRFTFASEIKSLLCVPEVSNEPSWDALNSYLSFGYVASPQTAFKSISKLRPGSWVKVDVKGGMKDYQYWSPPEMTQDYKGSLDNAKGELRELLSSAVKYRMLSDVPVGAFLSGGIDSTTIVALMAELSDKPVKTFTIGFDDGSIDDELPYARELATRYSTDHTELIVNPKVEDLIPKLVYHYNEPFADSSAIPTYYVSQLARTNVTVALSGDGGDEAFAGYNRYRTLELWQRRKKQFSLLQPMLPLVQGMTSLLPYSRFSSRLKQANTMMRGTLKQQYDLLMSSAMQKEDKLQLLHPEFLNRCQINGEGNDMANWEDKDSKDIFSYMMRHDQRFYLADELMVKTDIASMAHGLEVRAPLLDHRIISFAASLPTSWKINECATKHILREMARPLLPDSILNKPKTGFGVPIARWFREDLNAWVSDLLFCGKLEQRKLFQMNKLQHIFTQHSRGKVDWSNRLYAILVMELWFRTFID